MTTPQLHTQDQDNLSSSNSSNSNSSNSNSSNSNNSNNSNNKSLLLKEDDPRHEVYIKRCLEIARSAVSHGNGPFGSLLVLVAEDSGKDRVILEAENTVHATDVTGHAELNLCAMASRQITKEDRKNCVLYTSTEPCAMCSGAIYWTGIRRVVFGLSNERFGRIVTEEGLIDDGVLNCSCKDVFEKATKIKIQVHQKKFFFLKYINNIYFLTNRLWALYLKRRQLKYTRDFGENMYQNRALLVLNFGVLLFFFLR